MYNLKTLNEFVNSIIIEYDGVGLSEGSVTFQDLQIDKNYWMQMLKDGKYDDISNSLFVLVGNNYGIIDGHPNIHNVDKLYNTDVTYWESIETRSGEPVVLLGRRGEFGIKIFGIGHDGTRGSRGDLIDILVMKLHEQGYWMTASERAAEMLYDASAKYMKMRDDVKIIFKDIKWLGKRGEYIREHKNGQSRTETLFGCPLIGR